MRTQEVTVAVTPAPGAPAADRVRAGTGSGSRVPGQAPAGVAHPAPRRERKKRQTREALMRAALMLFEAKGYEHTTVREITDAIDVSERTFFRYFASKEDLALSFMRDGKDAMLRALAARPADEEPLAALRAAWRESLLALAAGDGALDKDGEEPAFLLILRVIESTPALIAAHLRESHVHDEELVSLLATREGVDPASDLRPRLAAMCVGGMAFLATRDWHAVGGGGVEVVLAAFDSYADQFTPALFGHWGR